MKMTRFRAFLLGAVLVVASPVRADVLVNQYTDDTQEQPVVAVAEDGSFVVVWRTNMLWPDPATWGYGLRARMFNADGTPMAAGEQWVYPALDDAGYTILTNERAYDPAVAIAPDGRTVVIAWRSHRPGTNRHEIFARRFAVDDGHFDPAATGILTALDADPLAVSGYPLDVADEDSYSRPCIALDRITGNFMVVWPAEFDPFYFQDIAGRVYGLDGTPLTDVFIVNDDTEATQSGPDIAVGPDGRFYVAWLYSPNGRQTIWLRRFYSDGVPELPEFDVTDDNPTDYRGAPRLGVSGDDRVAVVYRRGSTNKLILARFFEAASGLLENDWLLDQGVVAGVSQADLSVRDDGHVTIVWPESELTPPGLWAQSYGGAYGGVPVAFGQPAGPDYQLNSTAVRWDADLGVADRHYGFSPVTAWSGRLDGSSGARDIYAQPDADCNGNEVPDGVDISTGYSEDCDLNQIPDECDIVHGRDCNANGFVDACELQPSGLESFTDLVPYGQGVIPASGTLERDLEITTPPCGPDGAVLDVNVALRLSYPRNQDLRVVLTHVASGMSVTLLYYDNYTAEGYDVVFDDEARLPIQFAPNDDFPPDIEGTWRPHGSLAAFDGLDRCAVWRLAIYNSSGSQTGTLHEWALHFATTPPMTSDCNGNGIPDYCDIHVFGTSHDQFGVTWDGGDPVDFQCFEGNGIPDECEWPAPRRDGGRAKLERDGGLCQEPDHNPYGGYMQVLVDDAIIPARAAERFAFSSTREVDAVRWYGSCVSLSYATPCTLTDDFKVYFYENVGGLPSAVPVASYTSLVVQSGLTGVTIHDPYLHCDTPEYRYWCALDPPFEALAGHTYWVEIATAAEWQRGDRSSLCAWNWEVAPPGDGMSLWHVGSGDWKIGDTIPADLAICLLAGPEFDCNGNGIEDACDIDCGAFGGMCDPNNCGTSQDCNLNGIPDECELAEADCNRNGVLDECDIVAGVSNDINFNGFPDECDCVTATGDGDMDCDFDVRDFAVFQRVYGPDGEIITGWGCMDFNKNLEVDAFDFAAFTSRLDAPDIREALCTPRIPDGCPDTWFTGLSPNRTYYNFTGPRVIPADFFGTDSRPFSGQVELVGRPADPSGLYDYLDTQIEHGRIIWSGETELSVPAWVSSLYLVSTGTITVEYGGAYPDEQWRVLVTLSSVFPGDGTLTAHLDDPLANQGWFDATVYVQPLFVFIPESDLSGRIPPQCIEPLALDTAEYGIPPIELNFYHEPFVRWVDQDILDQYNIPACAQGNFIPGFSDDRDPDPCMEHVTEGEAHYFCPPECQPPKYCRYQALVPGGVHAVIGCDDGPGQLPSSVPGLPCEDASNCMPTYPFLVHCPGGGVAIAYYQNPECYEPPPNCKGACYLENCECRVIKEEDCTDLGGTFQGYGTKCEDMVDLDADSDASGSIAGSPEEDLVETDGYGPYIAVNNDDDDSDGITDRFDTDGVAGEDDLEPIRLQTKCSPTSPAAAKWSLEWSPADALKVWLNADRTGLDIQNGHKYGWTEVGGALPGTLHVEGHVQGAATVTLSIFADGSKLTGKDSVKVVVVGIEYIDSDEVTVAAPGGDEQVDVLPLFNPNPIVTLNTLPNPGTAESVTITVGGTVKDYVAPIEAVRLNGVLAAVTQTGSGTDGLGPYVGTFTAQLDLTGNTTLIEALAINSLKNVGQDSVLVRVNRNTSFAIVSRSVSTRNSVPAQPVSEAAFLDEHRFKVEVTFPELEVDELDITLDTGVEAKTIKLERVAGTLDKYRSKDLFLCPQHLEFPPGTPLDVQDSRLKATFGVMPKLEYTAKNTTCTDRAVPKGIMVRKTAVDEPADWIESAVDTDVTAATPERSYLVRVGRHGSLGETIDVKLHGLDNTWQDLSQPLPANYFAKLEPTLTLTRLTSDQADPNYHVYQTDTTHQIMGVRGRLPLNGSFSPVDNAALEEVYVVYDGALRLKCDAESLELVRPVVGLEIVAELLGSTYAFPAADVIPQNSPAPPVVSLVDGAPRPIIENFNVVYDPDPAHARRFRVTGQVKDQAADMVNGATLAAVGMSLEINGTAIPAGDVTITRADNNPPRPFLAEFDTFVELEEIPDANDIAAYTHRRQLNAMLGVLEPPDVTISRQAVILTAANALGNRSWDSAYVMLRDADGDGVPPFTPTVSNDVLLNPPTRYDVDKQVFYATYHHPFKIEASFTQNLASESATGPLDTRPVALERELDGNNFRYGPFLVGAVDRWVASPPSVPPDTPLIGAAEYTHDALGDVTNETHAFRLTIDAPPDSAPETAPCFPVDVWFDDTTAGGNLRADLLPTGSDAAATTVHTTIVAPTSTIEYGVPDAIRSALNITLRLQDVSQFHGHCNNAPPAGTGGMSNDDFSFAAGGNSLGPTAVAHFDATGHLATQVFSKDYGGQGVLRCVVGFPGNTDRIVLARPIVDDDGDGLPRTYERLFRNSPGTVDANNPLRDGLVDDEDRDLTGANVVHNEDGDGFTALEEYRGFLITYGGGSTVLRMHEVLEGASFSYGLAPTADVVGPRIKDVFVCHESTVIDGGAGTLAMDTTNAPLYNVAWHKIDPADMNAAHQINFNGNNDGLDLVQNAMHLVDASLPAGVLGNAGSFNLGSVDIRIDPTHGGGHHGFADAQINGNTIFHEMGHKVSLRHCHGTTSGGGAAFPVVNIHASDNTDVTGDGVADGVLHIEIAVYIPATTTNDMIRAHLFEEVLDNGTPIGSPSRWLPGSAVLDSWGSVRTADFVWDSHPFTGGPGPVIAGCVLHPSLMDWTDYLIAPDGPTQQQNFNAEQIFVPGAGFSGEDHTEEIRVRTEP